MHEVVEDKGDEAQDSDPLKAMHRCTSCYHQGQEQYMFPASCSGVRLATDYLHKYILQGCWTRCLYCQRAVGIKIKVVPQNTHHVQSPEAQIPIGANYARRSTLM